MLRLACLLILLPSLAGCQLMALPWLMWGKAPTKDIPAEYPYLADKKICVLVWAEMDVQFEYPYVELEVAEHLIQSLRRNVEGSSFVNARRVYDMQRRETNWYERHPAKVGKEFDAERVLLLELTQYATREPESPHLFRGRISANLRVYDTAYPDSAPSYRTSVESVYPPDSYGQWGADDREIREETMKAFAEEVCGRFYDRKVKVQ